MAKRHTGTGLVETTIQSLKNLIKEKLEDGLNLGESLNKALLVPDLRHTKRQRKHHPNDIFGTNEEPNYLTRKMSFQWTSLSAIPEFPPRN